MLEEIFDNPTLLTDSNVEEAAFAVQHEALPPASTRFGNEYLKTMKKHLLTPLNQQRK